MKKVGFIFLVALLVLSSCATGRNEEVEKEPPMPSYTDLGWLQSIKSTIYVALESNATTGYEWVVETQGESVVKRSEEYIAPEETGLLGAPGTWKAEFKAVGDGESTLIFKYLRPWDVNDLAEVKEVKVIVESGVITAVIEL